MTEHGVSTDELMAQFKEAESAFAVRINDLAKARDEAVRAALQARDLEYCLSQGILANDDEALTSARSYARETRLRLVTTSRGVHESRRRMAEARSVLSERWRVLTEATAYPMKQEEDLVSARRLEWVRLNRPAVLVGLETAWAKWEAVTDDYAADTPVSRRRVEAAEEKLREARELFDTAVASAPVQEPA
jgi:hypothetical protein